MARCAGHGPVRGHRHRSELQLLERTRATESLARRFGIRAGDPLFHSVVVHLENELPIQVEDRHVNPLVALVLGAVLAGERVPARTGLAAPLILGAVALLQFVRPPSPGEPPIEEE